MIINKNKPIHKGFIFLKKRFPVALTLSNGLFIHLFGCNAHQVSNKCMPDKCLTLGQNDHVNSFNKPDINPLQQSVINKLNNVYKILYKEIYGGDVVALDVTEEPHQLIDDINDLMKEQDLLKNSLRFFYNTVNHMYLEFSERDGKLYNSDPVIGELELLIKSFYEAYCGGTLESSKGYRSRNKRRSDLKKLYKAVKKGYQTYHSPENEKLVIQEIDILYQIFKIIYRVVLKPSKESQETVQKYWSSLSQSVLQRFQKSPEEYQKSPIKSPKTIYLLHKAYKTFCIEISESDPKTLDMYTEPSELLLDIRSVMQTRFEALDDLQRNIGDFLWKSSVMLDPRTVNSKSCNDSLPSTEAVYNVLGANVSAESKSYKRKMSESNLPPNKKPKFNTTNPTETPDKLEDNKKGVATDSESGTDSIDSGFDETAF